MELMRDARRIDPAHRPLIIAGGSHAIYEPHLLFNADPATPAVADVAVTGEEFVLLSLLEVLLSLRARRRIDAMRRFIRARDSRRCWTPSPGWSIRTASATAWPRNWSIPASSGCWAIWMNCR